MGPCPVEITVLLRRQPEYPDRGRTPRDSGRDQTDAAISQGWPRIAGDAGVLIHEAEE